MCADGSEKMDRAIQVAYVYVRDPEYTLSDSLRAEIDAKFQAVAPTYDSSKSSYTKIGGNCNYDDSQAIVDAYYAERGM